MSTTLEDFTKFYTALIRSNELSKKVYGRAFFKEGHDDGWEHYSICFPDKKIAIVIMTNNDNGESIFKELLAYSIGDTFTPWRWENYIPYDEKN